MYFHESSIIAANSSFIEEDVQAVDGYLYANQGRPIRISRLCSFTGLEEQIALSLLEKYALAGVVTECALPLCEKCDDVIDADSKDGVFECDLCHATYPEAHALFENVYIPRQTAFECGDEIPFATSGSPDVDGVEKIVGCSNGQRVADIVFVHGLDGDARTTWHPKDKAEDFWPKWLGQVIPNIGVWTLGYNANAIGWKGTSMPLTDRATNMLAMLEVAGIGERPVIFVVHSLGGLLVKQMLRHSGYGKQEWKQIADNTKGILFLATPHAGSTIPNYIKYLGHVLRTTVTVEELTAHAPNLRDLNLWFRANHGTPPMPIEILFETQSTYGVTVVDETSADPGVTGVVPIPMDADHISICKPTSKSHPVFVRAKHFIEKAMSKLA